jgi:predicted dehydrogenase
VKDRNVEAVFIATDAASHGKHTLEALSHGKHVGVCVPAAFGSLEEAGQIFETVKKTGLTYMMFETSCFHPDLYAMRQIYKAGGFGKLVYCEGEYNHFSATPLDSYKGWRIGMPPMWYLTHASAYYIGVTDGTFTEVSCMGMPSLVPHLQPSNNRYKNPFGTEIALFRTSEEGMSRMMYSKDTPGETGVWGRVRGQRGTFYQQYEGLEKVLPDLKRPPLPPGVPVGGHQGSHGNLTEEFITAILQNRKPLIDVAGALNMTVPGIVAHESALRDGELMKVPQFEFWS